MKKTKLNNTDVPSKEDGESTVETSSPHDIYDRMFKRIMRLSDKAIISFINGVFQKDYPEDSIITYSNTEFIDHTLKKVIADKIITVNGTDSYHLEAQLYEDDEIMIRFMEYGFHHALSTITPLNVSDTSTKRVMTYPEQILIYLDNDPSKKIPDEYPVTIQFPKHIEVEYHIPVLKFQEKDLAEIRDRHMVILLPFRLLRLRKKIEKEQSKESVQQLLLLYRDDIIKPIDKAYEQGFLTWRDRLNLLALSRRLSKHLYDKYPIFQEEGMNMSNPYIDLDIDPYLEKYDELEEKYNATKAENDELEAKYNTAIAENDELTAKLAEKDDQLANLQEQIRKLQAQLEKQ